MKLPKVYEPSEYESTIYDMWEKSDAFTPKHRGNSKSYSIVIPPPNANGNLHLGHGFLLGLEDIAVRYHRMTGKASLLLPGADHAGFETWVVYEKYLNSIGKTRFDYNREELYSQIWDFVNLNRDNILTQFRKLGASVDWSRYTYTLDDHIVRQAHDTFRRMFEEGLVYRAKKLVNFCTYHGTGFADIEVAHKEEEGKLYYIAFPLLDGKGEVVVATVRPETVVGQAALMVNPNDERYKHLIGHVVMQPLVPDVPIKIIAEDSIDIEFGTGVVTVTPGHAQVDYDVAVRHNLPITELITHEGKMSDQVPAEFRDMDVKLAREVVAKAIDKKGLLRKVESYRHSVAHCYKCDTVIEPLLREQWFIDVKPLAKKAIQALKADHIGFRPQSKKKQLIQYLEGLRDWNISRQIAWGIPIPAFQNIEVPEEWIVDTRVDQEIIEKDGKIYRRDPDVFDTWFSSSSWPYSTLRYPEGDDFKEFYPLSLMETGADILYPWVSRMIMFGLYTTGKIPFKDVYLHGLIQDEHGQKMSKSKGNVINPMDKVDEYGSDAFRMGIISGETAGSNRPFDVSKLVGARNFCNKLWNVARFIEGVVGDEYDTRHKLENLSSIDNWMLAKLQQSTKKIGDLIEDYRFSEAYDTLYHTLWDDIADWYIEASKSNANVGVLAHILETVLKLAHPFAPFVTETIWQTLKWEDEPLLITSTWPKVTTLTAEQTRTAEEFEIIKSVVTEARVIVKALDLAKPHLYFKESALLRQYADVISRLAHLRGCDEVVSGKGLRLTSVSEECWLDVDVTSARQYIGKLEDNRTSEAITVERLRTRLSTESYVKNAPEKLVNETRHQLAEAQRRLQKIGDEIKLFGGLV